MKKLAIVLLGVSAFTLTKASFLNFGSSCNCPAPACPPAPVCSAAAPVASARAPIVINCGGGGGCSGAGCGGGSGNGCGGGNSGYATGRGCGGGSSGGCSGGNGGGGGAYNGPAPSGPVQSYQAPPVPQPIYTAPQQAYQPPPAAPQQAYQPPPAAPQQSYQPQPAIPQAPPQSYQQVAPSGTAYEGHAAAAGEQLQEVEEDVSQNQVQQDATILGNQPNGTQAEVDIRTLELTNDTDCNSQELRQIILDNIDVDLNASKRLIQLAAETRFGGRFDVICSNNDFSYITNTELYCQETRESVSCYAYRQLSS